jgi:hypothetical protein
MKNNLLILFLLYNQVIINSNNNGDKVPSFIPYHQFIENKKNNNNIHLYQKALAEKIKAALDLITNDDNNNINLDEYQAQSKKNE